MVRPFTDGLEYCTVTVEIPIVWERLAAGLGNRGVVMPCDQVDEATMAIRATSRVEIEDFFIRNRELEMNKVCLQVLDEPMPAGIV